jgi:tRNA 2-thiouridine synthesizing protein B
MTHLKTLHILNKPPEHGRFGLCLSGMGPDDGLLMIENGVLGVTHSSRLNNRQWYALRPDLDARGLLSQVSADRVMSFDDMVELVGSAENVISW